MNLMREYVATLADEDKIRIILGHEQLEETGVIGDEPPFCFGEDDCSSMMLVQCPWRFDCGD